MKRCLRLLLVATSLTIPIASLARAADGQNVIQQLTDPIIGAAPAGPSGSQDTHDEASIEQLMKVVDLARTIGGGIVQLYNTILGQTASLEKIRDAQIGVRTFPLHNDPTEAQGRLGGPGLKEMVDGALTGTLIAPDEVKAALDKLRTSYDLDPVFALRNDTARSKAFAAYAAAQAAIASSTGEDSYKRANASTSRLDSYLTALQGSADLKTSVDINTRVMIELTQQTNESLRTQAAIASVAGAYFMILGGEVGEPGVLDALKDFNR